MASDFRPQKRLILAAVILLIVADVGLAGYSWRLSSAPQTPKEEFAAQSKKLEILRADIKRAKGIQAYMPHIQTDCDTFEHDLLYDADSGYSAVTADLGTISKKAALQLSDLTFKQKEIPNRKITEVAIDATVTGDYKNIVEFLNGLQRSKNIYEVDSLSLASEVQSASSALRVAIHMKTYFRTS
jgi:type IV pilus assembly protein PilO